MTTLDQRDRRLVSLCKKFISPHNFVAIPQELRNDPELCFQADMEEIQQELEERLARRQAA